MAAAWEAWIVSSLVEDFLFWLLYLLSLIVFVFTSYSNSVHHWRCNQTAIDFSKVSCQLVLGHFTLNFSFDSKHQKKFWKLLYEYIFSFFLLLTVVHEPSTLFFSYCQRYSEVMSDSSQYSIASSGSGSFSTTISYLPEESTSARPQNLLQQSHFGNIPVFHMPVKSQNRAREISVYIYIYMEHRDESIRYKITCILFLISHRNNILCNQ